jgi:hypothetical protein
MHYDDRSRRSLLVYGLAVGAVLGTGLALLLAAGSRSPRRRALSASEEPMLLRFAERARERREAREAPEPSGGERGGPGFGGTKRTRFRL